MSSTPPSLNHREIVFGILDAAGHLTRQLDAGLSIIKGISFSEYQMLSALRNHPSAAATRVDLAAAVNLSPSGVTRALKPMEKLGFVATTKDQRDARKALAQLTAAGLELVSDADGVVDDTLSRYEGLGSSPDDRRVIGQLLAELAPS